VPSVSPTRVSLLGSILLAGLAASPLVEGTSLPQDRGATGTWQMLLKLQTTASAMQVSAHPDEEPGGVLAWLSRHDGARVASLTLTRGEAGDNALGAQAFDALALLRTEELAVSNRYYGVAEQYYSTPSITASAKIPLRRSQNGDTRRCCAMWCASSGSAGPSCCSRGSRGQRAMGTVVRQRQAC